MKKLFIFIICNMVFVHLNAQTTIVEQRRKMMQQIRADFNNMIESIRPVHRASPDSEQTQTYYESSMPDKASVSTLSRNNNTVKPSQWPVSATRISSGFGYREDPFTRQRTFHNGVDIPLRLNTPIHAAGYGIVHKTGYNQVSGRFIVINHPDNYQTIYAHLNRVVVKNGDQVTPDTLIGYSGNTGRSTGPHLHFGLKKNGTSVDPLTIINP